MAWQNPGGRYGLKKTTGGGEGDANEALLKEKTTLAQILEKWWREITCHLFRHQFHRCSPTNCSIIKVLLAY
jgi:mevalonate kinase